MGATFQQRGWNDREVKVNKAELLAVLKKNREQHVRDYKEACAGYREAAMAKIEEKFADVKGVISRLKGGQTVAIVGLSFHLDVPFTHEKAYDQVIRMMEMEVEENVVLTASQFACFVMDDWDWKEQFAGQSSFYGGLQAKWKDK